MSRLVRWIKRQADQNSVTYSRFGLPGEETDERAPPTEIHVAPFNEDAPEFTMCGLHSQRAAMISSGVGMSLTIFMFVSVFFEFDWYHHEKGVDVAALVGLFLFLLLGIFIHYEVLRGIKTGVSRYLVPFIMSYTMIISFEAFVFFFFLLHVISLPAFVPSGHQMSSTENTTEVMVLATLFNTAVIAFQAAMLISVVRCRNFLAKRQIHQAEMAVAQKSKAQFPSMKIVFGPERTPHVGMAEEAICTPLPMDPSTRTRTIFSEPEPNV